MTDSILDADIRPLDLLHRTDTRYTDTAAPGAFRPRRGPPGILRFAASFRTLVLIWSGLSYNNGLCRRIHPYQLIRRASNALWEQLRIGILPGLKLSLLLKESHLRLARIQAGFIGGAVNGITFLDFILNS